jgi:AraC-like DNA-binding protein
MPPPDGNVVSRLPSTIEELLASGQPQIEDVAKSLGVSVRTLQRRIAENQSTFQREVERVREQMARALVGHGQVTLTEIASRLGYGDPSAFFRAFKRWTGVTPTEFRAQRA